MATQSQTAKNSKTHEGDAPLQIITNDEDYANDALRKAIRAIRTAEERCAMAGYGSEVMAPLDQALKEIRYALDTAEGRT